MPRQSSMRQQKTITNPPKAPLRLFCVGHLMLGLPFSVVCISSQTLLEKMIFSVEGSYQLEPASGLGVEHVSTFPIRTRTPNGLDVCRLCTFFYSVYEFICVSVMSCLEGTYWCLCCLLFPLAFRIFLHSLP